MPPSLPEVIGKYTIERFIESGGMGDVYLARDPSLDRLVAIKFLREGFDNEEMRERFEREARAAGRLSHPNIVTIYEFGEFDGRPFIAMEFVRGEPLAELIRRREPMPLVRKLEMMEGLCAGLAHAHRAGIVHRDIKPANLMVDLEGGVKVLDFGIVRSPDRAYPPRRPRRHRQLHVAGADRRRARGRRSPQRRVRRRRGVVRAVLLPARVPGQMADVLYKIVHDSPEPLPRFCPGLDPAIVRAVYKCLERDPTADTRI